MLALVLVQSLHQEPSSSPFESGVGGYEIVRIPSMVVTVRGDVLAFAEGRAGGATDQAENKILLRRSVDGGRTWLPLQVVADLGKDSLNNPCAVVDQKDGRIFLMFQQVPAGLTETSPQLADGYDGPNVYRSWLSSSADGGTTWTPPRDLTREVKRPDGVKTLCSGPGIGIQLTRGAHRGRLVFPFNEGPFWRWQNYAVYSDDHGRTWHRGSNVPGALVKDKQGRERSQINEVQVAENSDGSVLLNSRRFAGEPVRKQAWSEDGGESWSSVSDAVQIPDPSCMGSLLRYSFDRRRSPGILLYCGPGNSKSRTDGTLYESRDGGRTWPLKHRLWPGAFAYSVLTRFSNGDVGCLFETDDYRAIRFIRFSLDSFSWEKTTSAGR